jgi:aflatoxin B1 aldehyde reductase
MHHSALKEGDAIILGATKIDQLRASAEICKKGKLDDGLVVACEELWKDVEGDMPDLFDGK